MVEDITILHISDIHIGKFFNFDDSEDFLSVFGGAMKKVKDQYPQFYPPLFIFCTGDLTSDGSSSDMQKAKKLLKDMANKTGVELPHVIISPGNHDVDWNETRKDKDAEEDNKNPIHCVGKLSTFITAVRELCDPNDRSVIKSFSESADTMSIDETFSIHHFAEYNLIVYNLNSTIDESHKKNHHYGYVGRKQLNNVDKSLEQYRGNTNELDNAFKVVLVHHPFLAPDDHDSSALRDPIHFENWIRKNDIDMVLHGHQHYNKTMTFQDILPGSFIVLSAGSIGVSATGRDDAYLSFNIARIGNPRKHSRVIEILVGEFNKHKDDWLFDNHPILSSPERDTQCPETIDSMGLKTAWGTIVDTKNQIEKGGEKVKIDGTESALNAYVDGVKHTNDSLCVTSFLNSEFWYNKPLETDIVNANESLIKRVDIGCARRLFIIDIKRNEDLNYYIKRLVDRAYRHEREEDDSSLIIQLERSLEKLKKFSRFEMRIIRANELEGIWPDGFNPNDCEIAIYDNWRIDKFKVNKNKNIVSVEIFPENCEGFKSQHEDLLEFFKVAWGRSEYDIHEYLSGLEDQMETEKKRIDYTSDWLMKFAEMLDQSVLTDESNKVIEILKQQLESREKNRFDRYLDVGVCTGRYPMLLIRNEIVSGDHDHTLTIDIDDDVETYMKEHNPDIPFVRADIRSEEDITKLPITKFDLITCMLGTSSHFGLKKSWRWGERTGFEQGIHNTLQLLEEGGLLVLSVWSGEATMKRDLLDIYKDNEIYRLSENNPDKNEIEDALKKTGVKYRLTGPNKAGKLDIYLIEKLSPS